METEMNKIVTVGGKKYLISHANPEAAWGIGIELAKMIGEPGALMASAGQGGDIGSALAGAVKAFLAKVDPKTSYGLAKRILSSVECHGDDAGPTKKTLLDDAGIMLIFKGKMGDMIRLVGEVITFTQADFFEAIMDGIATMMKEAKDRE